MRARLAGLVIFAALLVPSAAVSQSPFSFQAAYDAAAPGAIIIVPAGQVATEAPSRGSSTIFGGTKAVTFTCVDPVTFPAAYPKLTIKAQNVTLRGACFRYRDLWWGEPGDITSGPNTNSIATRNVLVEGGTMQGFASHGAQGVLRNVEIGPNVLCYSQSAAKPALQKCDPSGPAYEADYAANGTQFQSWEPYCHNNQGGDRCELVVEGSSIHDIQTKDADGMHTGCFLVWQDGGAPGSVTFRNNRFERCAINGPLFDQTDGVTFENNWSGPPYEPFSNTLNASCTLINDPCALRVAPDFAKELAFKTNGEARDWLVRGNTFCHGTRGPTLPTVNTRFESNDLGLADSPWPSAVYVGNTNTGASCGGTPPPPPPPPPPPSDTQRPSVPSGLATSSHTQTSFVMSWNASTDNVGVVGYGVYQSGARVMTTTALSYTFTGLTCGTSYVVGVTALDAAGNESNLAEAIALGSSTLACSADSPPSAPGNVRVASSIFTSTRCSTITIGWDTASDDHGVTGYRVYKDGVFVATVTTLSRTFSTNCQAHTYTVEAEDTAGQRTASSITVRPTWSP